MLRLINNKWKRNGVFQITNHYRHFSIPSSTLSGHYDVVIAGGGAIGTAVGFFLSKHSSGIKPLLLEQASLTSGTTWHAASLLGTIRGSSLETAIARYTNYYLREIEAETGYSPSFKHCKSMQLACTPQRMEMLHRIKALCDSRNIEVDMITPDHAKELCPYFNYNDVLGALYVSEDGSCTSSDVVQCYVKGMHQNGGKVMEHCRIIGVAPIHYGLNGYKIQTNQGDITCDIFVNCAGQWAKSLGELCGVHIPLASVEHSYIISKPTPNIQHVDTMMPIVRDPDAKSGYVYYREWSGGMLCGTFEKHGKVAFDECHNRPPNDFEFGLFDNDWDHWEHMMDDILKRCPMMETAEIQMVCGPESFTMDTKHLIGDCGELFNYYVAAGMNSSGIASSAGIGQLLTNWIVHKDPTFIDENSSVSTYKNPKLYDIERALFASYPKHIDIKRFHPYSQSITVQVNGAKEALSDHVPITDASGMKSRQSVSNVRCSPLYHYQKYKQNAQFISDTTNAYSVAACFGHVDDYASLVRKELQAYDDGTSIIFDRSVDTKWLLSGKNANQLFESCDDYHVIMCDGDVCSVIILNKNSLNIEFMGDVWRLKEDEYMIRCPVYDQYRYLKKRVLVNDDMHLMDVSAQFCIFHVVGHNAFNDLMQYCHSSSVESMNVLGKNRFEWIDVGMAKVAVSGSNHCSLCNEYQLLVPSDYAPHLYELLCSSEAFKPAGALAWDSLRISNGIPRYNVDFDATYYKQMAKGTGLIKGIINMDENSASVPILFGGEPLVNERDDKCFGYVTSVTKYTANALKREFIAEVNGEYVTGAKLKIKVGNGDVDCSVNGSIVLYAIKIK
eukprot:803835_1